MSLQRVRGTQDLLPEVQAKYNLVVDKARGIALRFGFQEMSTPIFEFSDVFKRTLGEATDIVNKEMYTFQDRNGEEITLRPEGTASIARAFISEGLSQLVPLKLFYQGPMFRYERPQKGRYRQFHQFGVELLGPASPMADVEVISLGHMILSELKIRERCELNLNSIGDQESRKRYVNALVDYLSSRKKDLSADGQKRLETNPLRILDSKDEGDRKIIQDAPRIQEYYNEESKAFFDKVTSALTEFGISFTVNPLLVRGLDYYNHCVFEFRSTDLGAQDAVLSGGRYDDLIKQMGGPHTPGVGWAAGIERILLLTPLEPQLPRPVAVIPVHESTETPAFKLAYDLRTQGLACEVHFSGNLSKRMKKAVSQKCIAAILLGPDELARNEATLKWLDSGQQEVVPLNQLPSRLQNL